MRITMLCGLAAALLTVGACGGASSDDGGGTPAPKADVALLYAYIAGGPSQNSANDVVAKLQASGRFNSVALVNVSPGNTTPTLAALQAYAGVLVVSDATFDNVNAIGDVLADYVDAGGGVVLAVSSFNTSASGIAGRFKNDSYYAIPAGASTQSNNGTYGLGTIYDTSHPLMNGVSTFSGGTLSSRPNTTSVATGATRMADWNDGGTPLVALRMIGSVRRVDLGFKPASSDASGNYWDTSTDGAVLLNNALTWVTEP